MKKDHNYFVYILSNQSQMFYIGVTCNLLKRISEHKAGTIPGFTQKYNLKRLVYYEQTSSIESAITREKELKGWIRAKKIALVFEQNPDFTDLFETIV